MKILLLTAVIGLIVFANSIQPAYADVGPPPIFTQGGILDTEAESTNVSMARETVTLRYGLPREVGGDAVEWYGAVTEMPVHVTASFVMRNNGSEETISVYFPSNDAAFVGAGSGMDTTVDNFTVNGRTLGTENEANISVQIRGETQPILAYQWQQTFPPGQDTTINIEYDSRSGRDYGIYYLTYILGTGRGWQGPIGDGTVTFVLPKPLTSYGLVDQPPFLEKTDLPYAVSGDSVTLALNNYEPDPDTVITLGVYDFTFV
ncbi:MAG: hypothetical protein QME74_11615, partial [Candidatus Edwardsbacteria bacterium]|nr:hypothetical protein [Candidatus Edwardsbacteria bacterium]